MAAGIEGRDRPKQTPEKRPLTWGSSAWRGGCQTISAPTDRKRIESTRDSSGMQQGKSVMGGNDMTGLQMAACVLIAFAVALIEDCVRG